MLWGNQLQDRGGVGWK